MFATKCLEGNLFFQFMLVELTLVRNPHFGAIHCAHMRMVDLEHQGGRSWSNVIFLMSGVVSPAVTSFAL